MHAIQKLCSGFLPHSQLRAIISHPLNAPSTSIPPSFSSLLLGLPWSCCCITSVICYSQWCDMLSGSPCCCDKTQRRTISRDGLGGGLYRLLHHPFPPSLLCLFLHHIVIQWLTGRHWICQVINRTVVSFQGYHDVEWLGWELNSLWEERIKEAALQSMIPPSHFSCTASYCLITAAQVRAFCL